MPPPRFPECKSACHHLQRGNFSGIDAISMPLRRRRTARLMRLRFAILRDGRTTAQHIAAHNALSSAPEDGQSIFISPQFITGLISADFLRLISAIVGGGRCGRFTRLPARYAHYYNFTAQGAILDITPTRFCSFLFR